MGLNTPSTRYSAGMADGDAEADLEALAETVAKLAQIDERRAALIAHRNAQILGILDVKGATWVRLQGVTNLTPRGLQMAIKSAKAHRDGEEAGS